jgi:hypothetical protein
VNQLLAGTAPDISVGEHVAAFIGDAAVGAAALLVALPVAFFTGGFMAWEPCVAVIAVLLFCAGLLRGGSPPRNRWVKAARIDFGVWAIGSYWLKASYWLNDADTTHWFSLFLLLAGFVLPTVAGISLRRRKKPD